MTGLADYLDGWVPEPDERTDVVPPAAVAAFAGLLDQPPPGGAELPAMWHCFGFLDHPARAELGADGHPAAGGFLPPIPHRRRMFAGGRWRAERPLPVGRAVTRRASVDRVEVKRGRAGELAFVTVRQEFLVDGTATAVEEQDIVYRSEPPAAAPGTAAPGTAGAERSGAGPGGPDADAPADADEGVLSLATDPVLLFRFSALTANSHRIHYDHPYATAVEGHPGLLVHGPLIALLALETTRRRGGRVAAFDYRLRRPAFVGTPLRARTGRPGPDGRIEVSVGPAGGEESLTGSVQLEQPEN